MVACMDRDHAPNYFTSPWLYSGQMIHFLNQILAFSLRLFSLCNILQSFLPFLNGTVTSHHLDTFIYNADDLDSKMWCLKTESCFLDKISSTQVQALYAYYIMGVVMNAIVVFILHM